MVPEAGLEPARLAAQVFETCASADSATPASGAREYGLSRQAITARDGLLDAAGGPAGFEQQLRTRDIGALILGQREHQSLLGHRGIAAAETVEQAPKQVGRGREPARAITAQLALVTGTVTARFDVGAADGALRVAVNVDGGAAATTPRAGSDGLPRGHDGATTSSSSISL